MQSETLCWCPAGSDPASCAEGVASAAHNPDPGALTLQFLPIAIGLSVRRRSKKFRCQKKNPGNQAARVIPSFDILRLVNISTAKGLNSETELLGLASCISPHTENMAPRSKAKQDASQSAGEDDVVMHEPPTSHQPDVGEPDASMAEADGEEGFYENDEDEAEEEEPMRVKLVSCRADLLGACEISWPLTFPISSLAPHRRLRPLSS
jgi:hypothetical protein